MGDFEQYNHNDSVSLLVKIIEEVGATGGRRIFKFRVRVADSEEVNLIVWEGSPAIDVDWRVGEWYHLEKVLVKKWSSTNELNATKQTTAEKVRSKTAERTISGSEAVRLNSKTDRCGFIWVPDTQNNTESRSYCCYRTTWREFDRCIWHAETDIPKPPEALTEVREEPENRKLNGSPRELLSGAVLRNAELTDSVLTAVDFSGADFQNANLTGVYLSYSNLSNADLRGIDLTDCTVSKMLLKCSNLRDANLSGLSLFGIDFTRAELSDATFADANIKNSNFAGANPEAAKDFDDTEIQPYDGEKKGGSSGNNGEVLSHQNHSDKELSVGHTINTDFDREDMVRRTQQNDSESTPEGLNHVEKRRDSVSPSSGWDVDSLAAATTLDTSDIEDAVSRLTSSGCSRDEAIGYVRRYLTEMLRGEGLFAVYGVGPSSGHALVEAGITTIAELRAATPHKLSAKSDLSIRQIQRLQEAAQAGNFSSLESDNKQVAEQLLCVSQEFSTDGHENRNSLNSEESVNKKENQFISTSTKSTTESERTAREATVDIRDNKQETLTPSELPVPSLEAFELPDGSAVFPNYLSEYYESFRSAKRVLELVFQIPRIDIDPDDRRDPRVQYYVLLDACIGFGDTSSPFTGYGPQHQNRLPFSIRDYRKAFGDAETVTDYRVINVKRFSDNTHELLYEKTNVNTTRKFVRPCVPGTSLPLLELPGSFEELEEVLHQLASFPGYPPLPSENGVNDQTIPIAEIYQTCFADLDKEHQADLTLLTATESSPPTGPVPAATPISSTEAESTLLDFGRLSHLFKRVNPPADSPVNRALEVFALDWYRSSSPSFEALRALAKHGENNPIDIFRPRLRDLVHRRFLLDRWDFDYITVFPGHEAGSLSPQLVELAQDAVLETDILYTPLLERTETVERQREKSKDERQRIAIEPSASLRARAKLNGDTVILFDDICTTGSSLLAGAHLLRQAGADRVVCLTLGLTPGGLRENVKEITDPKAPASEIIAGLAR